MEEVTNGYNVSENMRDNTSTGLKWTVYNHIWIYTAPFILLFGISGNILTILVMSRPRMRGTSTSIYLKMLAFGDMTVIFVGLTPEWLSQLHIVDLWDTHPWVCKVELHLYYTALDLAIWTLVGFNCDRFIAVCFPLKKRRYCTTRRALIACAVVFAMANLNAHVFWTRGAQYNNGTLVGNCINLEPYVKFEESVRPPLVFVLAFLFPFIVIAFCNSWIIVRITSAKHMRQQTVISSVRHASATERMRKGLTQTTTMCISTSVAFLILVLPNIILFIGKQWWNRPDNDPYKIAKAISGQLVYIHHSINFILYSLTGSRFRREISILCGCKKPMEFIGRLRHLSHSDSSSRKKSFIRMSNSPRSSPRMSNSPRSSPRISQNSVYSRKSRAGATRNNNSHRYGPVHEQEIPMSPIKENDNNGIPDQNEHAWAFSK